MPACKLFRSCSQALCQLQEAELASFPATSPLVTSLTVAASAGVLHTCYSTISLLQSHYWALQGLFLSPGTWREIGKRKFFNYVIIRIFQYVIVTTDSFSSGMCREERMSLPLGWAYFQHIPCISKTNQPCLCTHITNKQMHQQTCCNILF